MVVCLFVPYTNPHF